MTLKCAAILFDLDGTLVDSRISIITAWTKWCAEHSLDLQEVLEKSHGRRAIDSVKLLLPHRDPIVEFRKLEELECTNVEGLIALAGAKCLLDSLATHQWAIVTSGSRRLATQRLTHCGITPPAVFITADDVTHGKPDPEGYMKAADQLGARYADCVVFEDAPAGIKAARAGGMRSIAFPTTQCVEALAEADYCLASLESVRIKAAPDGSSAFEIII